MIFYFTKSEYAIYQLTTFSTLFIIHPKNFNLNTLYSLMCSGDYIITLKISIICHQLYSISFLYNNTSVRKNQLRSHAMLNTSFCLNSQKSPGVEIVLCQIHLNYVKKSTCPSGYAEITVVFNARSFSFHTACLLWLCKCTLSINKYYTTLLPTFTCALHCQIVSITISSNVFFLFCLYLVVANIIFSIRLVDFLVTCNNSLAS